MSLNLQTLPHPNVRTAIADYSRDRLELMTRCAREFEDTVLDGRSPTLADLPPVLILATIAQTFHLELIPHQTIELQPSITLRPKHGIQVVLKKV